MNPIEALQSSDPAFKDLTPANIFEYFALMVPQTWVQGYKLSSNADLELAPVAAGMAGDLGALVIQHLAKWRDDSMFYNCLATYMTDQALKTRDPRIHQVVILDMTMDARAFYLAELADCHIFEVHRNAVVLEEKEKALSKMQAKLVAKERTIVRANPREAGWQDALLASGFDPQEPTFWVLSSHVSYMSNACGEALLATVASLSAPHSQLIADLSGGHTADFARKGEPDLVVGGAAASEHHGDNAIVFKVLKEWSAELLVRRDSGLKYSGSMWDPAKLGIWSTSDPAVATLGPWFVVRMSKDDAETQHVSLDDLLHSVTP